MKLLTLTDLISGEPTVVNPEQIVDVRNQPAGQCWIDLVGGNVLQVKEDPEDVRRMWIEATR